MSWNHDYELLLFALRVSSNILSPNYFCTSLTHARHSRLIDIVRWALYPSFSPPLAFVYGHGALNAFLYWWLDSSGSLCHQAAAARVIRLNHNSPLLQMSNYERRGEKDVWRLWYTTLWHICTLINIHIYQYFIKAFIYFTVLDMILLQFISNK